MSAKKKIYLDNAANTPLDKEVVKAMLPYTKAGFCGNSHSQNVCGAVADIAVDEARNKIAKTLYVKPGEVYFTSGATESNNWVIKGMVIHELKKPKGSRRDHIICSAVEHASVLNACKEAEKLGFLVTYINPLPSGKIPRKFVEKALKPDRTLLVCCMAVNNETGVANDVDAIAKVAHRNGARMLADFTQAMLVGDGGIRIGIKFPHVDYVSFSAHKIHGPTGVGCLVRRLDAPLYPLLSGGSQEKGLRGGTHNTAGIVGMGKAVEILGSASWESEFNKLFKHLVQALVKSVPKARLNAVPDHKNIVSLCFADATSLTDVASALSGRNVCCSAGAACSAGEEDEEVSHVLSAMGISERDAKSTVRVSFSKYTKLSDLDEFVKAVSSLCADFPKEEENE